MFNFKILAKTKLKSVDDIFLTNAQQLILDLTLDELAFPSKIIEKVILNKDIKTATPDELSSLSQILEISEKFKFVKQSSVLLQFEKATNHVEVLLNKLNVPRIASVATKHPSGDIDDHVMRAAYEFAKNPSFENFQILTGTRIQRVVLQSEPNTKAPIGQSDEYDRIFRTTWAEDTRLNLSVIKESIESLQAQLKKGQGLETILGHMKVPKLITWEKDCDGNKSPTAVTFADRSEQKKMFIAEYRTHFEQLGISFPEGYEITKDALIKLLDDKKLTLDDSTDMKKIIYCEFIKRFIKLNGFDTTMHGRQDGEVQSLVAPEDFVDTSSNFNELAVALLEDGSYYNSFSEEQLRHIGDKNPVAKNYAEIVSLSPTEQNILSNAGTRKSKGDLLNEIYGAMRTMVAQDPEIRPMGYNPSPIFLVEKPEDMAAFTINLNELLTDPCVGPNLINFFKEFGLELMCGPSDNGRQNGSANVLWDLSLFAQQAKQICEFNEIPLSFYPGWGNSSDRACLGIADDPMSRIGTLSPVFERLNVQHITVQGAFRHLIYNPLTERLIDTLVNSNEDNMEGLIAALDPSKVEGDDDKRIIAGLKQQLEEKAARLMRQLDAGTLLSSMKELEIGNREDAYHSFLYDACDTFDNAKGALLNGLPQAEKNFLNEILSSENYLDRIVEFQKSVDEAKKGLIQTFIDAVKDATSFFQAIEHLQPGAMPKAPSVRSKARSPIQTMRSIRAIGFAGYSINSGMYLGRSLSANGIKDPIKYATHLKSLLDDASNPLYPQAKAELYLMVEGFHGLDVDYLSARLIQANEVVKDDPRFLVAQQEIKIITEVLNGHKKLIVIMSEFSKWDGHTKACFESISTKLKEKQDECKVARAKIFELDQIVRLSDSDTSEHKKLISLMAYTLGAK